MAAEEKADEQAIQYQLNGAPSSASFASRITAEFFTNPLLRAPSPSKGHGGWPDEDEDEESKHSNSEDGFQYSSSTAEKRRGFYGAARSLPGFLGQAQGVDRQDGRQAGISDVA